MWTCLFKQKLLLFLILLPFIISCTSFGYSWAQTATFYEDFNTEGKSLRIEDIYDCTRLPTHWHYKVSSLDSHGNCLIFYDTPICKGRFIQVKVTHQDPRIVQNLKTLKFNDAIKSVKPCPAKYVLPGGAYTMQNVANLKYLTARDVIAGWTKLKTIKWKKDTFQKWKIQPKSNGTYSLTPFAHLNRPHSANYDAHLFDREQMGNDGVFQNKEYWSFIYLRGNDALIRNEFSKECLVMDFIHRGHGDISQTACDPESKYQQWTFRKL